MTTETEQGNARRALRRIANIEDQRSRPELIIALQTIRNLLVISRGIANAPSIPKTGNLLVANEAADTDPQART